MKTSKDGYWPLGKQSSAGAPRLSKGEEGYPEAGYKRARGSLEPLTEPINYWEQRISQVVTGYYENMAQRSVLHFIETARRDATIPEMAKRKINRIMTRLSLDIDSDRYITRDESISEIVKYLSVADFEATSPIHQSCIIALVGIGKQISASFLFIITVQPVIVFCISNLLN